MFMARRIFVVLLSFFVMTACRRGGGDNKGELVGVGGKSWKQPTPYGMTLIPMIFSAPSILARKS